MLKMWAIFGVLLIIFGPYCRANQIRAEQHNQEPTTPAPRVTQQQPSPASQQRKDEQDIHAEVKIVNPPEKDFYDKAPVWINLVLVGVALITGAVIGWQSWETRKAAQASRASIALQEAAMKQWVDVNAIECRVQDAPAGVRDFPFTVNLSFQAVNNTSQPFDILKIVTKIGVWPGEWEVFTVETNTTLAPQQDSPSKRYPFFVPTQSIEKSLFEKGAIVTINGDVTIRNCLGKEQSEYFGGIYRCELKAFASCAGEFRYLHPMGIVPDRKQEKEKS